MAGDCPRVCWASPGIARTGDALVLGGAPLSQLVLEVGQRRIAVELLALVADDRQVNERRGGRRRVLDQALGQADLHGYCMGRSAWHGVHPQRAALPELGQLNRAVE